MATSLRESLQTIRGGLGDALDFVSDCTVVALAVWTLIAYGGMATRASVSVLTPIWLATLPFLIIALLLLRRPNRPRAPEQLRRAARPFAWPDWRAGTVSVSAGMAAGAAAVTGAPWIIAWICAVISIGVLAVAWWRGSRFAADREPSEPRGHALAAALALLLAGMSLFLKRDNPDDVFYVGRATATAELDHIPVRDVIFTAEEAKRSGGTGLPTDSFSALLGAIGQLTGVHPASIAYYGAPPVFSFLAAWGLWRLIRSWAARRAILCFALGVVFWLWSAQAVDFPHFTGQVTPGNFFLARMWQGKVIFVAWLLPLMYVYLTRWLDRRSTLTSVLILASAVAAIGLTSSATFVVPLVFGAVAIPLAIRRSWGMLALVGAAAAFPVIVGLGAVRIFPLPSFVGVPQPPVEVYYHAWFGAGVVAFVATVGLFAAPWLARAGSPAWVTSAIAGVTVILLAPGVLAGVDEIVGLYAPGTLRRALWIAPLPALVGLLAAVPLPKQAERAAARRSAWWMPSRPVVAAVPATLIAASLIFFGRPVWSAPGGSYWRSHPAWKVGTPDSLDASRGILARYRGEGPILAPPPIMQIIPVLTVEPKAVNARTLYLSRTVEPRQRTRARLQLTDFVRGRQDLSPTELEQALNELRVGLVCVRKSDAAELRAFAAAGFQQSFRVKGHVCAERAPR